MSEDTPTLRQFLAALAPPVELHRPWPRFVLDATGWRALIARLATADWSLLGLWGESDAVHVALHEEANGPIAVASLPCPDGGFPSLGGVRPSAIRLERAIFDLFGHVPVGSVDGRPWLDHGNWPVVHPLAARPGDRATPVSHHAGTGYKFLAAESPALHQIAVGPVHAGIIEPGHFRFHANGETVARLEARLGYVHKGTERLMTGKPVNEAALLAARISGDSTVAHSLAFARAVEAALDVAVPPRAVHLRAVMAELERIANHLGDIGAICNDASFAFMHAHCSVLRERVLREAQQCFGHRLMMDRIVPGGVAVDLAADGERRLRALVGEIAPRFETLVRIYHNRPSLLDRTVGTGITALDLVHRFAAGGPVGRAAGRGFDARRSPAYPPYDALDFDVPVLVEGDVHSRILIRVAETRASLTLIGQLLDALPPADGEMLSVQLPRLAGEGMALVESFRGDILSWVSLTANGRIRRCHARDPSWFQWPLLEAAIEGNIVADFPLCNKSFNCSYSGHDL
jgi:Ni,Fe-hydrogenase III large subunit